MQTLFVPFCMVISNFNVESELSFWLVSDHWFSYSLYTSCSFFFAKVVWNATSRNGIVVNEKLIRQDLFCIWAPFADIRNGQTEWLQYVDATAHLYVRKRNHLNSRFVPVFVPVLWLLPSHSRKYPMESIRPETFGGLWRSVGFIYYK